MVSRRHASIAIATLGAVVAGVLSACAPSDQTADAPDSITIAVSSIPAGWDPFQGALLDAAPRMGAYEPLVQWEGEITPWLAKSWEISPDGRSIEFTLNENVDYVDGTHMTAQTVGDYLAKLFLEPGSGIYDVVGPDRLKTVEVTGEYTLKIIDHGEFRDFRASIPTGWWGIIPIISPAAVEDRSLLENGPQGTGPYLVDDYQPEVSISYVRNPDYWNPDAYPFDEVTYVAFADPVAILNALKTGQVDAGILNTDLIAEAEASGLNVVEGSGSTGWLEILDLEGDIVPALGDVRVRQAMNMAFDREAIGDAINVGRGYATSQLFTEESLEYVEGGDDRYPYDPERARELLADAGYPDGFDLTLPYLQSFGGQYIPVIQQALGDIGIRVTFELTKDYGELFGEAWPESAIALLNAQVTTGSEGFTPYALGYWRGDPEVERLAKIGDTAPDGERIPALTAAGPLMLEEARFVPVGYTPTFFVTSAEYEATLRHPFQRAVFLDGYAPAD
jgi:peptide/nickel transport system substrate-binding protein